MSTEPPDVTAVVDDVVAETVKVVVAVFGVAALLTKSNVFVADAVFVVVLSNVATTVTIRLLTVDGISKRLMVISDSVVGDETIVSGVVGADEEANDQRYPVTSPGIEGTASRVRKAFAVRLNIPP